MDFGGNFGTLDMGFGNLLEHNNILPENYTCVDIDKQAMDKGRQKHPNAEWIYYNRYNPMYNPNGQKDLFPTVNKKYDVIYSYSVFSHTSYKELLDFIQYFKTILTENGFMYLSVPCHEDKIIKLDLKTGEISKKIFVGRFGGNRLAQTPPGPLTIHLGLRMSRDTPKS